VPLTLRALFPAKKQKIWTMAANNRGGKKDNVCLLQQRFLLRCTAQQKKEPRQSKPRKEN
jgi:hypothetical protein